MPQHPTPEQIIDSREMFFAPVSLEKDPIFCGDERRALWDGAYIHLLGGALNISYNHILMDEVAQPDSSRSFIDETEAVVTDMKEIAHAIPGVHSDTHKEEADEYQHDGEQDQVGCGFGQLRKEISAHIAANREAIVQRAIVLYPEIFGDAANIEYAYQSADAHDRLAQNDRVFAASGRNIVNKAVDKGAKMMLVSGDHNGREGILNEKENESLDNNAANDAKLPAYIEDMWASKDINNRLREKYTYDPVQQKITEIVDTLGTMNILGVPLENIVVRR